MPTLSVNWNYKIYRVTVTPSTLLSDVLKESCIHFHLDPDTALYKLVNRNNKEVDLSLPFRFSNLAQGANLDIIGPSPGTVNIPVERETRFNVCTKDSEDRNKSGQQKCVNVRISVSSPQNTVTVTEKVANNISLSELLKNLKEKLNLNGVSDDRIVIQIMMRVLDPKEYCKPLASLGIVEGNHAIRVRIKSSEIATSNPCKKKQSNETSNVISASTESHKGMHEESKAENNQTDEIKLEENKTNVVNEAQSETADHNDRKPVADKIEIKYVQSNARLNDAIVDEHDDSTYEMDIEQAKIYQRILSKQAADQPLLTRALREKREEEERQKKEQVKKTIYSGECTFRIKFPDNKVIQIKIDNRKTLQDLAEVIVEKVLKPEIVPQDYSRTKELFFELYIAHPYNKILGQSTQLEKTIDDCEFGNRISLLFRFEPEYTKYVGANGYILDHLLEKIEDTNPQTQISSDRTMASHPSNNPVDGAFDKTKEGLNGTKRAKFKQVPSWMKLSKKV